MDLSEDDTSESESDDSMLDDDDDKELGDDNLTREQNSMSFQDHAAVQLGHGSGSGLGGASLRDRDDDGDDGIDFLKRRARLLHSQETHMEGIGGSGVSGVGGASLMPKLDLAEPVRSGGGIGHIRRQWGDHPSSSSTAAAALGMRHSLPLLSTNQASGE